jgi:hypothetical protein
MHVEWSLLLPLTTILAGIIIAVLFCRSSGQSEARIGALKLQHGASTTAAVQNWNQEEFATAATANAKRGRSNNAHAGSPMTKEHSIQRQEILCAKEIQQDFNLTQAEIPRRAKVLNAEQNMQSVASLLASAKHVSAERTTAPPGSIDAVAPTGWGGELSQGKSKLTPQQQHLAPPLQDFVKFWLGQSQVITGHDFSLRPKEQEVLDYLAHSISPSISKYEDCQKWVRA